jgi:hypothetical protein
MAVNQETQPSETTPLIPTGESEPKRFGKSIVYRALICGFMVSLSFGVTQVPSVSPTFSYLPYLCLNT